MNPHVLVIGAGGMLGDMVFQYLKDQNYSLIGITKSSKLPERVNMDVTNEEQLLSFLAQHSFDVVINCAALLVHESAARPADAIKLNSWFPHILEEKYSGTDTYLIQVSTDGVFSGKRGDYREADVSDDTSFYGKSKYLGELDNSKDLTVRSGFWGCDINISGTGLFNWFMKQHGNVSGYTQALFNGVSNLEFAIFADHAIRNRWSGIYHLRAADAISKYDFLRLQKKIFYKDIDIYPNEDIHINRVLSCTRTDIAYRPKTFEQMMIELKDWMANRNCYPNYWKGQET